MRSMIYRLLAAALISVGFAAQASAVEITYTVTFTGSGSLGATSFSETTLTWTGSANTANFEAAGIANTYPYFPFDSDTITIGALGGGAIVPTLTYGFANLGQVAHANYNALYFIDPTGQTGFAIDDQATCTNCAYDGMSNFSGVESLLAFTQIQTDEGTLSFTGDPTVTFTAVTGAAPEPSSLAIILSGLTFCVAAGLRRGGRNLGAAAP
jgi:hypothetical protein